MSIAKPPLSALQGFILDNSTRTKTTNGFTPNDDHIVRAYQSLAIQVAHNIKYQHKWTDVRIHESASSSTSTLSSKTYPHPLISGLPPHRLYVHPDEQIEFLKNQAAANKAGANQKGTPESKLAPEREWVLPSHLREKWTLKRFATVFDGLDWVPPTKTGRRLFEDGNEVDSRIDSDAADEDRSEAPDENPWRTNQPKRLLLATVDDDSTIVYYIVHDGIVKPRQN